MLDMVMWGFVETAGVFCSGGGVEGWRGGGLLIAVSYLVIWYLELKLIST